MHGHDDDFITDGADISSMVKGARPQRLGTSPGPSHLTPLQDYLIKTGAVSEKYLTCDNCKGQLFTMIVAVRQVSALMSASGRELKVPVPAGYSCAHCGLLVIEEKKEAETGEPVKNKD